jgi:hypothetical protein
MPKRITLDTGVARECCYEDPQWLETFVSMKLEGWSFHLTDICVAELIAAFERGSISDDQWNLCMERVGTFLSDWMPCLPGKRQLFHLCEFEDLDDPNKDKDSVEFQEASSGAVWQVLRQFARPDAAKEMVFFEADGKRFKCPLISGAAEKELNTERSKWLEEMGREPKTNFNDESEVAAIKVNFDTWAASSKLPLSIRGDILAHAQIEWGKRIADGYSPGSKKRRNDGIDFLLQFAFMWPALLVTTDGGVCRFLRGLDSYQASWVYLPIELATVWKEGRLLEPEWTQQIDELSSGEGL